MTNELVIFDFDGVLVETEQTTFDFYQEILPSYGLCLSKDAFRFKVGRKSIDFLRDALGEKFSEDLAAVLIEEKRKAFLADVTKYLKPVDGAFDLLEQLKDDRMKMVIGSQNEKPLLEKAVDAFGIRHYFAAVLSLQDITKKKPDPEIVRLAAARAGVDTNRSVVIEDSPHGLEAAHAADSACVGITTSFTREQLSPLADHVIDSMRELNPSFLRSLRRRA